MENIYLFDCLLYTYDLHTFLIFCEWLRQIRISIFSLAPSPHSCRIFFWFVIRKTIQLDDRIDCKRTVANEICSRWLQQNSSKGSWLMLMFKRYLHWHLLAQTNQLKRCPAEIVSLYFIHSSCALFLSLRR